MSPVAVLIGAPGSGKSTVGRLLADRFAVTFRDTDADVEAAAGKAISEIFVDEGEPHFRRLERAAVRAALAEHDGVLALGGGAVIDPDTRADLKAHHVVFLDVTLADASSRVGLNRDRPLLLGNVRSRLNALMTERRSLYEEVAEVTVSTHERDASQVAEAVAQELSGA